MSQREYYFCYYAMELGLVNWSLMQELSSVKAVAVIVLLGRGVGKESIIELGNKLAVLN